MSISPTNEIVIAEHSTLTKFTADFSHVETYEEMGAIGATLKEIANSSPYWLFYWTLEMVARGYMTKEDVYAEFTGKDTKTIDNWFALAKCRYRLPKQDSDNPHDDWSFSHFVETASLSDEDYETDKQWIIAQEKEHMRIASINKYRMHKAGKDPYPVLPPTLRLQAESVQDAIDQLRRKLPENWSGEVSVVLGNGNDA